MTSKNKAPLIEDLTQTPDAERTNVLSVKLPAEVIAGLQAEADRRGVTLEEYARWLVFTEAELINAGGSLNTKAGKA